MLRIAGIILLLFPAFAQAGAQMYEPLSASVKAGLHIKVSDKAVSYQKFISVFSLKKQGDAWLDAMSKRLEKHIPNPKKRINFLMTVYFEARRAGLDPQLILGIIQVESGFRKYAVSRAGAHGYMQVMPFWRKLIGIPNHNLFHLRINLRYGCTILRHYLVIEKGNYFRALGRYNGSLGKAAYPNLVKKAWHSNWAYSS
jgi:soluble lytic murein transglycosylase-like protein